MTSLGAMVLYIDPGTGSMLFTVLIGIIGFLLYIVKVFWIRIKFVITRGKAEQKNANKIPYLIFAEDKRYWQVFKPVCDEFEKRGIDVVYWTMTPDDPVFDLDYEHIKFEFIGEGNKAFAKLNVVNAGVILATTPGLDVYQWRRSKNADCYVHMFHSVGYCGYRMFGIDFYDAVIAAGQYQIDIMRELERTRDLPAKEGVLVGMPYFDELKKKLNSSTPVSNERTTVLLAPSWGENSIFTRLGSKVIDELVKTDYDIIIRPHPQSFINDAELMKSLMEKYPENDHLKWDRSSDNFETLKKADIMISDFSGVMYDFAFVFDKPVIYLESGTFDTNCRDYYWLDPKYYWILNNLPNLGKKLTADNVTSLNDMISECLASDELKQNRTATCEAAWAYPGEAAVRTVDYLVQKSSEIAGSEVPDASPEAKQ